MLTFPLAPGVHIDDTTRTALPVTATAPGLPVMIIGTDGPWSVLSQPFLVSSFTEIERWLQETDGVRSGRASTIGFASARPVRKGANPAHQRLSSLIGGPENQNSSEPDWTDPSFSALKAYFDNGGGACYLCRSDQLHKIADLSDATLVVQAGQPLEVGLAISALCQPGSGWFALLDGPNDAPLVGDNAEPVKRQPRFDAEALAAFVSEYNANASAALYYPWLSPQWLLYQRSGEPVEALHPVAPSAVAAALIQQTDRQIGPWKAPANLTLQPGLQPLVKVGDTSQARFNQDGKLAVNMLREFPGIGVQLWGARTLSAGDVAWTYVPVRRTFDRIERDMQQSLRKVLFKPNGPQTWQQLRNAAENYLFGLFQDRAFAGTTPEQSYQIQVGVGSSMTEQDLNDGILRMNIGLAVVRPAEFIVLEFSQTMASAVSGDMVTPIREPLLPAPARIKYELAAQQLPGFSEVAGVNSFYVGHNLSVSNNGETVFIAGRFEKNAGYLFSKVDGKWQQKFAALIDPMVTDSRAKSYTDLTSDGQEAFILKGYSNGVENIYHTKNNGGVWDDFEWWTKSGFIGKDGKKITLDYFYSLLASSSASGRIAIGVELTRTLPLTGGVYIFSKVDETEVWREEQFLQQKLPIKDSYFGQVLAFSGDANVLAVGARNYILDGKAVGSVTIFSRVNEKWQQDEELFGEGGYFADSISLNAAGTRLAVAAYAESKTGAFYIYEKTDGEWKLQYHHLNNESGYLNFGYKVKLNDSGDLLIVSALHTSNDNGDKVGAVLVYKYDNEEWVFKQKLFPEGVKDQVGFGISIALANDGAQLFVAAHMQEVPNSKMLGKLYIYDLT